MTVLTKSDLVDPETAGMVRLEVDEFVAGRFLEAASPGGGELDYG